MKRLKECVHSHFEKRDIVILPNGEEPEEEASCHILLDDWTPEKCAECPYYINIKDLEDEQNAKKEGD